MELIENKNIIEMLFRMNSLGVSIRDVALYLIRNEDTLLFKIENGGVTKEEFVSIKKFLDEYEKQSKVKAG